MTSARLRLREVSIRLGGRPVVDRLSLDLQGGSLVAVVGPNGAGKTSILRALVGLLPHEGAIEFDGVALDRIGRADRARAIAYLPQGHEAHWPLPAHDIVALGRIPHGAADPTRLRPQDQAAVAAAMRLTDTTAFSERPVTALSGGERARVALARVFAVDAPVILADEPTAALDPRHQIDVMCALRRRADEGALVVAVTHDLGLAARFADAVTVLEAGRLAAYGPPAEALAPAVMSRVFGIEAFRAEHCGQAVLVPWA